jgi:hypothetical protein
LSYLLLRPIKGERELDPNPAMRDLLGGDEGQAAKADAFARYRDMLRRVGNCASEIGPRPVASHWPFRGSAYRSGGLFYVGQALDGWDAVECSARWWAEEAATVAGRERILQQTASWTAGRPDEPIAGVFEHPGREGSAFWTLGRDIARALNSGLPEPWYAHLAWGNVYPLAHEQLPERNLPRASPRGALKEAQDANVGPLLKDLVDLLEPSRVVIVAGPEYWRDAEAGTGVDFKAAAFPLLRIGRSERQSWIVGYHPRYFRQESARRFGRGTGTNAAYVAAVIRNLDQLEGRTG